MIEELNHTLLIAFSAVYGVVFGFSGILAFYLLTSRRPAFNTTVRTNPFFRRVGGIALIFNTLSLLWWLLIVYSPVITWLSPRFSEILDTFVVIPANLIFLFGQFQNRKAFRYALPAIFFSFIIWMLVHFLFDGEYYGWLGSTLLSLSYLLIMMFYAYAAYRYVRWLKVYGPAHYKSELLWCVISFVSITLLGVLYYYVPLSIVLDFMELIFVIVFSVLIVWRVDHQPWVLEPSLKYLRSPIPTDAEEAEDDATSSTELQWMGALLDKHCRDEQRYLDFDISLEKLSEQLSTNRTYLSRYLANQGMNFREYINGLRIQHACRLMNESEGRIVLKNVASKSGFRHLSTFRRVFKEQTGVLPSEYKTIKP